MTDMIKAEQVPETVAHVAEAAWSKDATWQQIIAAAINAWPGMMVAPPVLNYEGEEIGPPAAIRALISPAAADDS